MPQPPHDPVLLDAAEVRRAANAAARTYDEAAALQKVVRERLLERLDYVSLQPKVILDLGAATGHGSAALAQRYPDATVVAVDIAEQMLLQAMSVPAQPREFTAVCADAAALPFRNASVDLVFCSLLLPWCNAPTRVFEECRRILQPGGLFNFATAGPDTLYEMRAAWAEVDSATHVNRFLDMHDVGDGLLAAGMAEPVLDVDYFTLTYKTVKGLMRDLQASGAHNATQGRPRGLTSRARMAKLCAAYEKFRGADKLLPMTWEIIFGQAWGQAPGRALNQHTGEAQVPLSMITRRQRGTGG